MTKLEVDRVIEELEQQEHPRSISRRLVKEYYQKRNQPLTQADIDRRDDSVEPQGNTFWRLLWRHRNER